MFSNDIPKSNKSYTDLLKNPVDDILGMGAQLKPKNSSGIDKTIRTSSDKHWKSCQTHF